MSEEANQSNTSNQPDPAFKLLTALEAKSVGLIERASELQFSSRTDLILTIPPNVLVKDTMFDPFRETSVVEFKSENDPFTLVEFVRTK